MKGRWVARRVRRYVEESDCVILLGTFMTDINLGIYTAHLDPSKCIYVTSEKLRIHHHHFHDVLLSDFVKRLAKSDIKAPRQAIPAGTVAGCRAVRLQAGSESHDEAALPADQRSARREYRRRLRRGRLAVCRRRPHDPRPYRIYCPRLLRHDGFRRSRGDRRASGQFQTAADRAGGRRRLSDDGDGTVDGRRATDSIPSCSSSTTRATPPNGSCRTARSTTFPTGIITGCPSLLGGGRGFEIRTEGELDQSLKAAFQNKDTFSLLNIHLDPFDISPALDRLTRRLAKKI